MNGNREHLIAWALGDLPPAEAEQLEQRMAQDPELRREGDALLRQLNVIKAVPEADAPDAAVQRLLATVRGQAGVAPVFTLQVFRAWLPRVAAVAVFALMVGVSVAYLPEGPAPVVGTVADGTGPARHVGDGELIEARIGSPMRVTFASGELLVDGGGALRLYRTGATTPPIIEVDRGRVVVDAKHAPLRLTVSGHEVALERGAVLGLDYDRQHARIVDNGAIVEVQRTSIDEVLKLARETYGVDLVEHQVPEAVKRQRVTFSGTGLDGRGFIETFAGAASRYGVEIDRDGQTVRYIPGTPLRVDGADEAEVLSLTVLQGHADLRGVDARWRLAGASDDLPASMVLVPGRELTRQDPLERAVVWAQGMGNHVVDARLADVSASRATLPTGAVIYPDRLVLPEGEERIFVLDGPDFAFPLPGGRKGRLVGLLSSGAEFEVEEDDRVVRTFVPFSRMIRD